MMARQSPPRQLTESRVDGHRVLIAAFLGVTVIGASLILWWLSLRVTLAKSEEKQQGVFGEIRKSFNDVKENVKGAE